MNYAAGWMSLSYHIGVCVGLRLFFYKAYPFGAYIDLTTEKSLAAFV